MIAAVSPWIADALVVLGILTLSAGVYGMIWMPDIYTRLHAASKAVFLGIIPLLLAAMTTREPAIFFRALLTMIFLLLTVPVAAHAIGHAAYLVGERMETPDVVDESGQNFPKSQGR